MLDNGIMLFCITFNETFLSIHFILWFENLFRGFPKGKLSVGNIRPLVLL